MTSLKAPLTIVAVAFAATAIAACGGSSDSSSSSSSSTSSSTTATKDDTIANLVPAKYASSGSLSVGVFNGQFAPMILANSGSSTITGADPDFINAIAQVMGLTTSLKPTAFASILPAVQNGTYDAGISAITDTTARQQTVDFVTYMNAGVSFFDSADAPSGVSSLADLCGKKLGVLADTTQASDAAAQSAKCTKAGKAKVDVSESSASTLAQISGWLTSGRVEVAMTDSPLVAYEVQQSNGVLQITGDEFDVAPYGIAVAKGSGLAAPILAAVKQLIAGGQYQAILKKWGIEASAINDPKINGATSAG